MISRINAQIVMIGMESEQIIPMLTLPLLQEPPLPTSRSLCSGNGSTARIRSIRPKPLARWTWPHSMSESTNAVFLLNLRNPAGLVSIGRVMRIGRAGASASKKFAS